MEIHPAAADAPFDLHFSVRDTGIGIRPEKQQMVFDNFTQADSSTTRVYGGTGLGLSISKRLVEMMGGRIWLESEPGCGTTVHFTAHLERDEAPLPGPVSELPGISGAEVLVVDDNVISRDILATLLKGWQMRAFMAASAVEGIELLRSRSFALLLLDVEMPGMNGFDMLNSIAPRWPNCNMPVILLSPLGRSHDRGSGQTRDVPTIYKPVRPSELQQRIATALGHDLNAAQFQKASVSLDQRSFRILLAEDNPVNQKVAQVLLERAGHKVTIVPDGVQAVAAAANATLDVILMDVQMPEMDGLEATRAIRQRETLQGRSRIPIIAMTAHAMASDRERCLSAGMDGYTSKPIHITTLLQVIADVCSRHSVTI